ncbi:MAG: hypothetical protein WC683_09665 [bacterium]
MSTMDELTRLAYDVWFASPAPGSDAPWFCRVEFRDGGGKRRMRGCVGDTWEEAAQRTLGDLREALGEISHA